MPALNSLQIIETFNVNVAGGDTVPGLSSQLGAGDSFADPLTYGTTVANGQPYGADTCFFALVTVPAGGSIDIDLSSYADLAGKTAAMAHLKKFMFALLGANQTAPDTTPGNGCTSVSVGGGANAHPLNQAVAAAYTVDNGGILNFNSGAGVGFVVDGTHHLIHLANNDGVNDALMMVLLAGTTT